LTLDGDGLVGRFSGKDSGAATFQAIRSIDVSGAWSGDWEVGPDGGPGPHYMVLKQDGADVTGTAGPDRGAQMPIRNGRVADGQLTFFVGPAGGPSLKFNFKVEKEAMRGDAVLSINGADQKLKLAVKRISTP
jgi:hypothetical protein